MLGKGLVERLARVDAAAVDRHARCLVGKPFLRLGQPQLPANHVEQVLGVGAVVDREVGCESDGLAVAAQESGGDGVEGAAPDAAGVEGGGASQAAWAELTQGSVDAADHFGGGTSRESQQKNARGVGPLGDEPNHAMHQGGGLSGPGPGHDEQGVVAVLDGEALLVVEAGQQGVDAGSPFVVSVHSQPTVVA